MPFASQDQELLAQLSPEKLIELLHLQIKNIWRVDGLYFLGIEKRRGTDEATDVDAECWAYLGRVEARQLKKFFGVEDPDPAGILLLLRHTSWGLDQDQKSFQVNPDGTADFSVDVCHTQLTRIGKNLGPHPCRRVREGYLKAFVTECNSQAALDCLTCPPERTDETVWCRWRIRRV